MSVLKDTLRASAAVLMPLCLAAFLLAGWKCAVGAGIGVAVGDLEIAAMALLGTVLLGMQAGPNVIRMTLLFAVLKLPIVGLAVFLAVRLGWSSLDGFLGGFGLVYCALVLVGLRQFRTQKRDLFS